MRKQTYRRAARHPLALAARRAASAVLVEAVERRVMMSAAVLSNGTLTVSGTGGNDSITLGLQTNPTYATVVTVNGATQTFDEGQVAAVVVNAGDGTNTIQVNQFGIDDDGGPDAITVNGGSGDDQLNVNAGGQNIQLVFNAGNGNNTATLLSGDFMAATLNGGAGTDSFTATEDVSADMNGGTGNETFYLPEPDRPTTVMGGGGDDTLVVDPDGNYAVDPVLNLDGKNDSSLFAGTPATIGADIRNVELSGNITGASITGDALDNDISISQSYRDSFPNAISVHGGDGNDRIAATGPSDAAVDLYGDAGNDTIVGGYGEDNTNGQSVVSGGPGTDLLDLSATTDAQTVYLDGSQPSGTAEQIADGNGFTVDGTVEQVYGGGGNDRLVAAPAGGDALYGNGGNDTLVAQGGTDALFGGDGNDQLDAADGGSTYVDGGAGTDAATIDQTGDTTINVESVSRVGTNLPVQLTGTTASNSGSYQNDANTAPRATDGSLSTYFDAAQASGAYVELDLGTAESVDEIRYAPRSGYESRMIGGVFEASNSADFSGAATEYTVTATPPAGSLTAVDLPTTTAYRYWRYVSPANGYANIAEFQLFGPQATTSPTPTPTAAKLTGALIGTTGSYANSGNTIAKAVDGSLSTYFDSAAGSGSWVGYDLGTAATIASVSFAPRSGYESRMVGGVFQGSNSPQFTTGVVNLYTVRAAPKAGVLTTGAVSSTAAFRYVRYLSPTSGYGNVAEVNFFGSAGPSSGPAVQLTGTAIGTAGSYQNQGNTVAKALDGNLSTFFDGPTANGDFVGLDLGTQHRIDQVAFAPRSGYASRMVGGVFQVSTSADFSTGVSTVYTVTAAPASGVLTTVGLTSPAVGRYVRYLAPNGSEGDVAEVQFSE